MVEALRLFVVMLEGLVQVVISQNNGVMAVRKKNCFLTGLIRVFILLK